MLMNCWWDFSYQIAKKNLLNSIPKMKAILNNEISHLKPVPFKKHHFTSVQQMHKRSQS